MKKLVFTVIMAVSVVVVVETMAQMTYLALFGKLYDRSEVSEDAGRVKIGVAGRGETRDTPKYLYDPLHPYLGFVRSNVARIPSGHGFRNVFAPDAPVPEDTVSILLTGGSVANGLTRGRTLTRRFNAYLKKQGKPYRVRIFTAALGGYKQPQQLLAATYFLSLGAHFDIVINVDGFNEIVLPYNDNARFGVNPFFPRSWANRLRLRSHRLDPIKVGELAYLREQQVELGRSAEDNPVSRSAIVGLVLKFRFQDLERDIARANRELVSSAESLGFEEKGPEIGAGDQASVHRISADMWARASIIMARQMKSLGIEYYHFLQPSQYLKDSKPLSDEERERFYLPTHPYGQNAIKGYPLLVEKGREINQAGVNYFNATQIFSSERSTVFNDVCCHLNEYGNGQLVDFVVESVMSRTGAFPDNCCFQQHFVPDFLDFPTSPPALRRCCRPRNHADGKVRCRL